MALGFVAPEGYVTVVCRLCNEPWFIPEQYSNQFDANHGFECVNCRKAINSLKKYARNKERNQK